MNLNDIEFINPEKVTIKSEVIKEDVNYNEDNFEIPPITSDSYKCGEVFTSNTFDFWLVCAYCGNNFINTTEFGEHLRFSHQSYNSTEIGNEALKSEPQLSVEDIVEEGDFGDDAEDQEDDNSRIGKVEKRSKPKYVCQFCKKPYRYKQSFERHRCPNGRRKEEKSLLQEAISDTSMSQPSSAPKLELTAEENPEEKPVKLNKIEKNDENCSTDASHQSTDDSVPIKNELNDDGIGNPELFCEICYRQFKYKNVFRKHGMQHDVAPIALQKDPTYRKCLYCGISFTDNGEWFRHENQHPKTGPFRCSQCSKKFKTEIELEAHAKSHADQEPVTCEQCGMQFSQAKNLASHINRVHLQLKPFSCDLCDRKFVRKVELRVHMRRHTGERPYQCEECGRSFMISTLLNEHLKRHSNVRDVHCPVCPMAFFTKKMLRKHMVKHSTERPYVCPTCGNNFSRKKALLAHKKIHMEIKQYVCNLCGKAFAQHAGLYMHKKTHMNAVDS